MYWSINKAMTYDPYILFVVGERGVGKTYSTKRYAINRFIKYGEEFIYLRRYPKELKEISKFFDDVASEFPDHEFEVKGRKFYCNGVLCGYTGVLSQQQYLKSTPFPRVHTLIYDEFIIDDMGFTRYIPNEVTSFYEILETIFRMRDDVRIIMLSNALSINNPYFMYLNIRITDKIYQVIDRDEDTGRPVYMVENVRMEAYREAKRKTMFAKAIKGTAYESYAIDNKMLRDSTEFVEMKSSKAKNEITIINQGHQFSVWFDYQNDKCYVVEGMVDHNRTKFVIDPIDHDPTKLYPKRNNFLLKAVEEYYRRGRLFFDSEVCYARFKDVLWLLGCK